MKDVRDLLARTLQYTTVQLVHIHSWKLGLFYYLLQLSIVAYIFFWILLWNRGYQSFDSVVGVAFVKVKGNSYYLNSETGDIVLWDAVDAVYPSKEADALFVTTSVIPTFGQKQEICEGNDIATESCAGGCVTGKSTLNGIMTGTCGSDGKFCLIHSWCPLEGPDSHADPREIGRAHV